MLERVSAFVRQHVSERALVELAACSALAFLLSLALVPLLLTRIAPDHFVRQSASALPRNPAHWLLKILKNALGVVLVLLGILMLVLPGQGVLTIAVGGMLLDLPGKQALLQKLIFAPRVIRAVNALRARAGRPPLEIPHRD